MKKFEDLTDDQLDSLRYCAKVRCVDCERACYSQLGLSWDEWKRFATLYYAAEKEQIGR